MKKQWCAAAASIVLLASCGSDPLSPGIEFMPDMYRAPSYKPYEENVNYKDMPGALMPVPGTISQGSIPNSPWHFSKEIYLYPNTPEGYELAGTNLKNPVTNSPEVIAQGKDLYTKFCSQCHGDDGNGNGTIVANGKFPSPGKYADKILTAGLNEGKMFHSITYGKGLMGQHASQLNKEERWKVIHYINSIAVAAKPAAPADTTAKAETPDQKEKKS